MFGMGHSMSAEMQTCMEDCHHCHMTCLQMAATHCLEMGGKHTEPAHMRLMLDCAEICQTAMNFMARNSAHHSVICRACAEICRACADSCEQIGEMEDCAAVCRRCAASCEQMSAVAA